MEDILHLYSQEANPKRPRICYDERPCQIVGNVLVPLPMRPGNVTREHYEYKRHGVVHALLAYNIDTGERYVHLRRRRRALEYAHFMAGLAKQYPDAERIELVQDNLNIHDPASFYKVFDPATALCLTERFAWHYTPVHASWLNMAELEFSAYARQCANQRWSSMTAFVEGSMTYFTKRNQSGVKIDWTFTEYHARETFKRHYELIKII
jgi:DDE superfamily endonuclease